MKKPSAFRLECQRGNVVTSAIRGHREEVVDARTLNDVTTRTTRGSESVTRQERKQRTRQALLEAALDLLADRSFSRLSLREVTKRAGIVPTAFYRHFTSMDELGRALVDEVMRTLRTMIRDARRNPETYNDVIRSSIQTLYDHVRGHESHFRFLTRERYGSSGPVQSAISTELRLFSSELAIDLSRIQALRDWSAEDLYLLADLLVMTSLATVVELLDVTTPNPEADAEILRIARKRLRLIVLGVAGWRSDLG